VAVIVLGALIGLIRRRDAARLQGDLEAIGSRLDALAGGIEASTRRHGESGAELGEAIGSTLDLDEVMGRTLSAAGALPGADGCAVEVVEHNGALQRKVWGIAATAESRPVGGPPDGRAYGSTRVAYTYEGNDPGAIRSSLSVPLRGEHEIGTLTVYSRLDGAFSDETLGALEAVARRAGPALANAIRHRAVEQLAVTDELTRLLNRRGYDQALEREIALARRTNRSLALLVCDLDHFKEVNERHELPGGDAVLAAFADAIRAAIRTTDIACRRGGEEFAIILPETSCAQAVRAYNRLRAVVAGTEFPFVGTLTFSAGLADLRGGDDPTAVDARAAQAEGRAKTSGRDRLETDCLGA
jgi:diguanylate cyclase (GGDEF)-like protein